jgi:hypothetical protein
MRPPWQPASVLGFGTKRPRAARECSSRNAVGRSRPHLFDLAYLPKRPSSTMSLVVCNRVIIPRFAASRMSLDIA